MHHCFQISVGLAAAASLSLLGFALFAQAWYPTELHWTQILALPFAFSAASVFVHRLESIVGAISCIAAFVALVVGGAVVVAQPSEAGETLRWLVFRYGAASWAAIYVLAMAAPFVVWARRVRLYESSLNPRCLVAAGLAIQLDAFLVSRLLREVAFELAPPFYRCLTVVGILLVPGLLYAFVLTRFVTKVVMNCFDKHRERCPS